MRRRRASPARARGGAAPSARRASGRATTRRRSRATSRSRRSPFQPRPMPRDRRRPPALDFPRDRARPPLERHPGRLRPPQRGAGDPGRGRVRRRHRRRSGRPARHPGDDAEPARGRHDQPQFDPARRGAGAARRDRSAPAPASTGPSVSLTAMTPTLGAVARSARRRRPQPGLRSRRGRAHPPAAARRHRRRADPAAGHGAAALPGLLYGADHPYGKPFSGTGDPAVVRALTRDELVRFHQSWIRPDNATIFVVSDLPLAQLVPLLEARFGNWRPPAGAARHQGVRRRDPGAAAAHRADRPAAIAAIVHPRRPDPPGRGHAGPAQPHRRQRGARRQLPRPHQHGAARAARLVLRRPRQRRSCVEHQVPYIIQAPVQADRTGDSIAAAHAR